MIEKELKFAITAQQMRLVSDQLKKVGGVLSQRRTRELNTIYDDPVGSFQIQDVRLCLQSGINYSLSYEKAVSRRGVKQDLVIATRVGSIAQMKKILQRIGLRAVSHYVSHRTVWHIGSSSVSLYEFKFGTYLEITGEIQQIVRLAERLGFNAENSVMASYDDLYRDSIAGRAMATNSE